VQENKNPKARVPQTIDKNPYNLKKMDLCAGYSFDRRSKGEECIE
jgi:hypothetical protein